MNKPIKHVFRIYYSKKQQKPFLAECPVWKDGELHTLGKAKFITWFTKERQTELLSLIQAEMA